MGESKRRAATGRNRAVKAGAGILLPHLLEQSGPTGVRTRQLDGDVLNSAIIYWDKIACPTNNFIHVALREEDTLIKEGLLIRPRAVISESMHSGELAGFAARSQAKIFRDLEISQPGFWAFGEGVPADLAQTSEFTPARTALVTLVSALPLPAESVPTDRLLEFKLRRLPELQRLRHTLDAIYLKIADSQDPQIAMQYELEELDKACADATKISKEWWKAIKLSDLKSLLTLGGTAIGSTLGLSLQMPTTSAIVGGAGTALTIASGIRSKFKSDRKLPFWYASEVKRNL